MKFPVRAFFGAAVVCAATSILTPQLSQAADGKFALKDEPRPSNIRLQETEMGVVFTDSRGMTLYTDNSDPKENVPACTDNKDSREYRGEATEPHPNNPVASPSTCLMKHPPVLTGDAKPVGAWTVLERSNGIKQWAYRGHPVYTSIKDLTPGQAYASVEPTLLQYRKRWMTIFAPLDIPSDISVQTVGEARVFATFSGRTLYTLAQDRSGKSTCEDACLEKWQPFLGGAMSQSRGEWALATRSDGTRQWAFRSKPLYMFKGDRKLGDTNANNLSGSLVAVAYAAPPPPSFVTVQGTPVGDVYADERGHTLYAWICSNPTDCDDVGDKSHWWFVDCGNSAEKCTNMWHPVLATPGSKPIGNTWSIVNMPLPWSPVRAAEGSNEQSVKVWAQNGRPLFTYDYEDRPGMLDGDDYGTFTTSRFFALKATGRDLNKKGIITQAAR